MRNHQQHDPQTADIAKLGDATLEKTDESTDPWLDPVTRRYQFTDDLIRYGATFWKKVEPEPGYRLVEDHERVGEKPKGCRCRSQENDHWSNSTMDEWLDYFTYAVPIKPKVVAVTDINDGKYPFAAYFANREDRDRAVRDANEREEER